MSISIRNSQLNNETINALNSLIEMDINASIAFKLTRIIKELSSIIEDKMKMEKIILDKWVEKDDIGNPILAKNENGEVIEGAVNIENVEQFTIDMNNLMEVVNDLPFDQIKFEDLMLKTAKIKDLIKLDFLFI